MRASRGFSAVAGLTPCEAASVVRTAVSGSRMRELVLVRHGESEGNVAYQRSKMGDASMYSGEFLRRHSGQWRLTDQGIEQAEAAGAWLRAHYPEGFERLYVSEYLRAKETAGHLNLPPGGASGDPKKAHMWFAELVLREREFGRLEHVPHAAGHCDGPARSCE